MTSVQEFRQQTIDFLEDRVSLTEFEDWIISHSWNIHKSGDSETQSLAYEIDGLLMDHADDPDETALRRELGELAGRWPK